MKKKELINPFLIRKSLHAQATEHKLKEIGEKYRKGFISIVEAAALAKVSISEMMDYIEREKIQPPTRTTKKK